MNEDKEITFLIESIEKLLNRHDNTFNHLLEKISPILSNTELDFPTGKISIEPTTKIGKRLYDIHNRILFFSDRENHVTKNIKL